jgi:hypothetical protein
MPACADDGPPPARLDPPGAGGAPPGTAPRLGDAPVAMTVPAAAAVTALAAGACEQPVTPTAAQALAGGRDGVALCCEQRAQGGEPFMRGCRAARACRVVLRSAGGTRVVVDSAAQLVAAVAPVDTTAKAIGLVALLDRDVWLPFADGEREQLAGLSMRYGWQPYADAPVGVEVEEHAWGFVVRAPTVPSCGCGHHLVRRSFRVERSGAVCAVDEPEVALAFATTGLCID